MKLVYLFWLFLLTSQLAMAQMDSAQTTFSNRNIERRSYAEYDEEIMYYGKRNEYFTVRIFRKNGVLFRLDSYRMAPKMLPNGMQLDSISRIFRHGPTKIMYPTGRQYVNCEYKDGLLHGPFMVFYEDGSMKRREYFKFGRITKSKCYTSEGDVQSCEPFYQPTKFTGKPKELATYLNQKLGNVLDGERIRRITATITINEIGQIIYVSASVNANPVASQQALAVKSYVQQIIRNMPEWNPDTLNWKPALNDGIAITSTCVLAVFRINGSLRYDLSYQM